MEPSAKRSKHDDDGVLVLKKLKGRIVLRIDEISEFLEEKQDFLSEPVRISGFDWTLCARPLFRQGNGLKFYIQCDGSHRGPIWNCAASVILLCISGTEKVELARNDNLKFDETTTDNSWIRICEVSFTISIILIIYF